MIINLACDYNQFRKLLLTLKTTRFRSVIYFQVKQQCHQLLRKHGDPLCDKVPKTPLREGSIATGFHL